MGLDGSKFVIEELLPVASKTRGATPAKFTWDVEHRNMPEGAWEYAITQRSNRVDYPGGDSPTEQILGPNYEPFEMKGAWLDKWNYAGYARDTRRDFEVLVRRGHLCKFICNDIVFVGLIKNLRVQVKNMFTIRYQFTVSPHNRGASEDELSFKSSGPSGKDPRQRAMEVQAKNERLVDAMVSQAVFQNVNKTISMPQGPAVPTMPLAAQASILQGEILSLSRSITNGVDDIFSALDKAVLSPVTDTLSALKVLASSFAIVRGRCQQVIDRMATVRSDTQTIQSAIDLHQFHAWSRGISLQATLMWGDCYNAEEDLVKKTTPDIMALHLAQPNESLYRVALRYYGSPTAWKIIAERNHIEGFMLNGGELLVIPEAPRR